MSVGVMKDYKLKRRNLHTSHPHIHWVGRGTGTPKVDRRSSAMLFVYYESIKRELKIRSTYECRCYERLQTKTKEFTRLTEDKTL